ncbi:MAG TPA: hypothetical protein VEX13_04360, partial [Chloroflexia bacterium]|nr:hypothetical protein [Chloroflexia bacterium]
LAVAAVVLTGFGASASPSRAQAQGAGADAIDAVYPLSLTEVINNRNPDVVLRHFVDGATVTFDNSVFGVPNKTMTAAQYAERQDSNQPDVPTDIRLEVVDGSQRTSATRATWLWRETAGFLRDVNTDYIEFSVVAQTEDRRFKSLTLAPTNESLAKLISLAPSKESLARLPYSPALPALPFTLDEDMGIGGDHSAVVLFEPVGGSQVDGAAILSATGKEGGTTFSLHVTGLTPGTPAQATLHAGTCSSPGASFARLAELTADTQGRAAASGQVLFRGEESIALPTIADGEHFLAISQSGKTVSCGLLPGFESSPATPPGMPRTGNADLTIMVAGLAFLGILALGGGLALRRQH